MLYLNVKSHNVKRFFFGGAPPAQILRQDAARGIWAEKIRISCSFFLKTVIGCLVIRSIGQDGVPFFIKMVFGGSF